MCPEVDSLVRQLAAGKGEFFDYVDDSHRAGKDEAFTCVYMRLQRRYARFRAIVMHFQAFSCMFATFRRHFEAFRVVIW